MVPDRVPDFISLHLIGDSLRVLAPRGFRNHSVKNFLREKLIRRSILD